MKRKLDKFLTIENHVEQIQEMNDLEIRSFMAEILLLQNKQKNSAKENHEISEIRNLWHDKIPEFFQNSEAPNDPISTTNNQINFTRETFRKIHNKFIQLRINEERIAEESDLAKYIYKYTLHNPAECSKIMDLYCQNVAELLLKTRNEIPLLIENFPLTSEYLKCLTGTQERLELSLRSLSMRRELRPFIDAHNSVLQEYSSQLRFIVPASYEVHIPSYLNYHLSLSDDRTILAESKIPTYFLYEVSLGYSELLKKNIAKTIQAEVETNIHAINTIVNSLLETFSVDRKNINIESPFFSYLNSELQIFGPEEESIITSVNDEITGEEIYVISDERIRDIAKSRYNNPFMNVIDSITNNQKFQKLGLHSIGQNIPKISKKNFGSTEIIESLAYSDNSYKSSLYTLELLSVIKSKTLNQSLKLFEFITENDETTVDPEALIAKLTELSESLSNAFLANCLHKFNNIFTSQETTSQPIQNFGTVLLKNFPREEITEYLFNRIQLSPTVAWDEIKEAIYYMESPDTVIYESPLFFLVTRADFEQIYRRLEDHIDEFSRIIDATEVQNTVQYFKKECVELSLKFNLNDNLVYLGDEIFKYSTETNPLLHAITNDNKSLISKFIEYHQQHNSTAVFYTVFPNDVASPLAYAAFNGKHEELKAMLTVLEDFVENYKEALLKPQNDPTPTLRMASECNLFQTAAAQGNTICMQVLFNSILKFQNPIHDHLSNKEYLISLLTDFNSYDKNALIFATQGGSTSCFKLILDQIQTTTQEFRKELLKRNSNNADNLIDCSLKSNSREILTELNNFCNLNSILSKDEMFNFISETIISAKHNAAHFVIERMLERTDLVAQDHKFLVDSIISHDFPDEMFSDLIKKGLDVDLRDHSGYTRAHNILLTHNSDLRLVSKLIEFGSSFTKPTSEHESSIHLAIANREQDTVVKMINIYKDITSENILESTNKDNNNAAYLIFANQLDSVFDHLRDDINFFKAATIGAIANNDIGVIKTIMSKVDENTKSASFLKHLFEYFDILESYSNETSLMVFKTIKASCPDLISTKNSNGKTLNDLAEKKGWGEEFVALINQDNTQSTSKETAAASPSRKSPKKIVSEPSPNTKIKNIGVSPLEMDVDDEKSKNSR